MKRISKHLRSIAVASVILGIIVSCQVEDDVYPESNELSSFSEQEDMIKLGKKLENPYSVTNMKRAWDSLQSANSRISEDIQIEVTHYYVKFIPETEEELDILNSDSTLILYDYPLDHEIDIEGDYYRDPDIPEGQPTPQYCAVEVDYQFPGQVEHEILEELFIPDDFSDDNASNNGRVTGPDSETVDRLVYEAMKLTGNLEDTPETTEGGERARICLFGSCKPLWRPAGRIMVWDDRIGQTQRSRSVFSHYEDYDCDDGGTDDNRYRTTTRRCQRAVYRTEYYTLNGSYVPLHNVRIDARRWFTIHEGYTGTDGRYSCNGTFKNPANYRIKWDRYDFSIRSGPIGQASLNGPKITGDWNVNIADNNIHQFYAIIFQAARDYYYGNILGLKRPPRNSFWKPQMKIGAYDEDGKGVHNKDRRFLGLASRIKMYRFENDSHTSTERMYSTTLHELAHASHWESRKNNWGSGGTTSKLKESWAIGVSWALTRLRYPNHNWYADLDFTWMRGDGDNRYTSLIIDLIDDTNQGGYGADFPIDRVTNYSISQIESVLGNCGNIYNLRDQLKNRHGYRGNEASDYNYLFDQYGRLAR